MDKELSTEEVTAFLQQAEQLMSEDDCNIFTPRSPEKLLRYRDEVAARAALAREKKEEVAVQPKMAQLYG